MILRWSCLLFTLVHSIKSQTNVPTEAAKTTGTCDAGLFTCRSDGLCIPMEWVGDQEIDCSDGSDENETPNGSSSLPISSKSSKIKQKSTQAPTSKPLPSEISEEDSPSSSTEDPTPCDEQHQRKLNECANDLNLWANDLSQNNFSSFSLFSSESSISIIEKGCNLFNDFNSCIDGLPASCHPQNEHVHDFQTLQMYFCELLVPSVKEHWSCFSSLKHQSCPASQKQTRPVAFCSLVDSVNSQIECIANQRPKECDDVAIELFEPMKMESQHSLEDIDCLMPDTQQDIAPTTSANIDQQPIEHELEVEKPRDDSVQQVKPILEPIKPSNAPSLSQEDLSNSLFAFGNVEKICAENKSDIWAMIRSKICSRKNDLVQHSKCFLDAAERKKKCLGQLAQQTQCSAIDAFNKNVDCVINELNELCPIEAQDIVIQVQEGLNDDAIGLKCYEEKDAAKAKEVEPIGDADFKLNPQNPRCNSEQENQALVCLVELIEINNKLTQFQTTNFLVEISDEKSQLINPVCDLYNTYERCLNKSVFNATQGQRCAFSSPLNTLARIGLSPICAPEARQILFSNKQCLQNISKIPAAAQCQSGLQYLGRTVELMLQGIHSEALLCNTFYMLRNTFECGESLVHQNCDERALGDLTSLKEKITSLGIVEGCPKDKPADLDAIIARPVNRTQPDLRTKGTPVARPMNTVPISPACEPEEQKKFGECIQPLTAFQPHPIAVIKQPKEIDNACKAYKVFNECRKPLKCNPLWARGMSAMFEFACGAGYERFNQVRTCIRKTTTREDIRECVATFSKGAPQKACESSNRLLACALPPIKEKCGPVAVDFVKEYVQHFASTIDPQCKIGEPVGIKAIHTHNCSASEDQLVQHCSAPLNDLSSRLEELFQGGLQSFLKNLNNLAPVFAQGCNLSSEFRECARPILDANNSCTVSSCLVKAGNQICNQPDIAAAIDTQLGCIFKQVSQPEFGKCLRNTIAKLSEFNLASIRNVLPQFTSCVEPIVLKKCGPAPLNVLRALGSKDVCPVSYQPEITADEAIPTEATICTDEMREEFHNCSQEFYAKYSFEPITILNKADDLQELCQDIESYQHCFDEYSACEQQTPGIGLRSLVRQVCSSQDIFKQHQKCLVNVKQSEQGQTCLNEVDLKPETACPSLIKMVDCVAKSVQDECGEDSLKFMVDITNDYLHNWLPSEDCTLNVPTVALETGCSEQQLIQYLECESLVDSYRFRPITFIGNASNWDSFCQMVGAKYRPCLDKLECRFEPVSTASITLFENLCEREITKRDQRKHAECLGEIADSPTGKKCLELYKNIDLLTKDAPEQVCSTIGQILQCIGLPISERCGSDALLHVYDIHGTWTRVFNSTCVLQPSEVAKTEPEKTEASIKTSVETSSTTTASVPLTETSSTTQATTKSTLPSSNSAKTIIAESIFVLSAIWLLF